MGKLCVRKLCVRKLCVDKLYVSKLCVCGQAGREAGCRGSDNTSKLQILSKQ